MNTPEINMFFKKRPSGVAGIVKGIWNRKSVYSNRKKPGRVSATIPDVTPCPAHVRAFNRICRIPESGHLHPLYPLTYVYPLTVRVLGHKKSGFDIFKSLNVRSWVHQKRKINVNEALTFHCGIRERRILDKGVEIDVGGEIVAEGQRVWECCYTFFWRGRFGTPSEQRPENSLPDIEKPEVWGEWFLEKGGGFRFARISGDTNGIHYWDSYARMLGFKGAFAQPVLVLGRSHDSIPLTHLEAFSLEQRLKGPVYYNSRVIIKGDFPLSGDGRFDIYCEDNPRPCICCQIRKNS